MAIPTLRSPANAEPKSPHVADNSIRPFLQADFDPVAYLNSTLPPLSLSGSSSSIQRGGKAVLLPELSSQLQTLLAQLNAQTTRLSSVLAQLTDEIIRSGSRLAYEVEVLRGETLGLTDTFENGLKKDIESLVPSKKEEGTPGEESNGTSQKSTGEQDRLKEQTIGTSTEPEFLERLRNLTTVRERLDAVIKTFGSAMQWPLAPSETSLTSSLISVSGPESSDDSRSREGKGKEYMEKLRSEINDHLATGVEGLEAANTRVTELRALAEVFKGTAEEKARNRLVDSLQRTVDDKQKALDRTAATNRKPGVSPARGHDMRYGNASAGQAPSEGGSGYGFLQNLRNLKNEVYMD